MRASQRSGRAAARRLRERLSSRELAVLKDVERFRYMSARQIEALHFFGHATALTGARACRRVLERLTVAGALVRLERRIGGVRAGSASFVYALGAMGAKILHGETGSRIRHREPSAEFLDHTLAVVQLVVDLRTMERSGDLEIVSVETEPACWRRFAAGLEGMVVLKPDLAVTLAVGDFEYHWFVEIDRATHSSSAVLRKCRVYQDYWTTGLEQSRTGLFPRVLFVTPNEKRASLLRRAIHDAARLNDDLIAVTPRSDALGVLTGGQL